MDLYFTPLSEINELEKRPLKDAREQLFGAQKENELLAERITKAESLETELRQLLKNLKTKGAW